MFYVRFQPEWGVIGGLVYLGVVLAATETLKTLHYLSTFTAFLGMAAASLAASLALLIVIRPRRATVSGHPTFGAVMADHWRYGRWSMATAAISWFPLNVYYAILPLRIGLEGAGGLRALMNLAMPVLQTIAALSMLLLPLLAREWRRSGPQNVIRTMYLFGGLFCAGAAFYFSVLWVFRSYVFELLYAGKYKEYASWPLALAGLLPFTSCISAVLASGLRAIERPDYMFWCYLASGVTTLVVGIPLASAMGVGGALAGLIVSSLVAIVMMLRFSRQLLGKSCAFESPQPL
jgi:O-antigen/teichoic acid export membrane protein